ncbi:MAG TPA: hypothetical protein VK891_13415 [Euzebyales bacterium]|nr:hypothetical protein [Euzebyales bacterium]
MGADGGPAQGGQADIGEIGDDVEARLLAAVQAGDETAFWSALRAATFVLPVHAARGQTLRLDMDGVPHQAVFTSTALAQQAVARFTGGTDGWQAPSFTADEFVEGLAEADPPDLLLNPGTQVQRAFKVQQLVQRWRAAGHDVRMPRKRRGSLRAGLMLLVFAVVALLIWGNTSSSSTVLCGSQTMSPDDTCIVTTNGSSTEQTYEETQRSQRRTATIALGAGAVLVVAGTYNVVARIVTRRRT